MGQILASFQVQCVISSHNIFPQSNNGRNHEIPRAFGDRKLRNGVK